MKLTVKLLFLTLLLICAPAAALAGLADQLEDDFATISGVVVMPINDEYIVDLDARDNLNIGDILSLVNPGKKIFHPETKEVIGSVDDVVGFLQVTRIYSGYSYAKVLTAGLQPDNSAPVKRFEKVPAILQTEERSDLELARQLQFNLPQFDWLQDTQKAQALLIFSLQEKALDVKTAEGDALHRYKITEDQQLVSAAAASSRPSVASSTAPKPKLLQQVANSVMGVVTQTNEELYAEIDDAIIRQKQTENQNIWLGPSLAGHPTGLVVADLDGDGQQEVAVVLDNRILIARISAGEFTEVAELAVSSLLQTLSIDALDLNGDGRSELYVSAIAGQRPSSLVVEYADGDYSIVIDSVRWLLRSVRLPGEEAPSLVGQRLGNIDQVFSGAVFRVTREKKGLVEGAAVPLPEELNLFNFMVFTDDTQQVNFAYLTPGDYLKVVSVEGVELWESGHYFGGSEDCFTLKDNLNDEIRIPTCMQPRMLLTPNNEILVAQNDGQRLVQRFRRFNRSRIQSLSWNGFTLTENWQTASQLGYLADFTLADADNDGKDELVMAIKFKHKGLTEVARSSIVIYELE